ncbi:MAG: ABC transporter permease [Fulvivirga sp.]
MERHPPKWILSILNSFCHEDYLDEVRGDLEEVYRLRVLSMPQYRANWLLLKEVIFSFKSYVISGDKNSYPSTNQTIMLRNYITIAYRNLMKNKFYSALNILGLTLGLTCSLLIFSYVVNELSFDKFHSNAENTYRVIEKVTGEDGAVQEHSASVPWPVGPTLQSDHPDAIVTRMYKAWQKDPLVNNVDKSKKFYEKEIFFVDTSFFKTFSFDLIEGDKLTALKQPQSVVITESTANRYFGNVDVLGQTLILENSLELTVTGVTKDVVANSHFHYDFLIPLLNLEDIFKATGNNWGWQGWYWNPVHTYVTLPERYAVDDFEAYMQQVVKDHFPQQIVDLSALYLQPLVDIHTTTDLYQEIEPTISKESISIAAVIAGFILIIAAINFINLSTASATRRSKEVAMRKVLGSTRKNLIMQFFGESILLSFLSLILSIVAIYFILPTFEYLLDASINIKQIVTLPVIVTVLLGTLLLGVLSGVYPAFILSGFKPAEVLKTSKSTGNKSINLFRKSLVVFQFMISIVLLVSAFVIYQQYQFLTSKELGFSKEEIVLIPIRGTTIIENPESFKTELLSNPQVVAASAVSDILGQDVPSRPFRINGYDDPQNIPGFFTDHDFAKTFGINIIEGRDFDKTNEADHQNLLMNEAMLDLLKDKNWEGQQIGWGRGQRQIIGMVEDFNFMSLKTDIKPLFIGFSNSFISYVAVRVSEGNVYNTLAKLESSWKKFEPEKPFVPLFLDQKLNELYQSERKTGELIGYFSGLAILIAFLGLVGLVTYRVNSRTHEIGIRKVLGATASNILNLLSVEFIVLAWPFAWYIMTTWLENFTYKIALEWWHFGAAGIIAVLIASLTVFVRSYKAILTNPVETIREN